MLATRRYLSLPQNLGRPFRRCSLVVWTLECSNGRNQEREKAPDQHGWSVMRSELRSTTERAPSFPYLWASMLHWRKIPINNIVNSAWRLPVTKLCQCGCQPPLVPSGGTRGPAAIRYRGRGRGREIATSQATKKSILRIKGHVVMFG